MGVRVDHSVSVPLFLESCVAPFTCSLEWTLTSVFVDWFRRDLRVSRVPRGPERGRQEIERRSSLAMLACAPSRLEKLNWEPIGFFTTLMSLAELDCGGGGGGGGGGAAWIRVAGV